MTDTMPGRHTSDDEPWADGPRVDASWGDPASEDGDVPLRDSAVPARFDHTTRLPATPSAPLAPEQRRESVTCPECGTIATVALARRESGDFCSGCEFPLFWTPTEVRYDESVRVAAESLRRLPGTGGRVTVASVACPHCAEANALAATTCSRCGLPMMVSEPLPPPAPLPPPPAPAPVPVQRTPWWVWVVGGLTAVLLVILLVVLLTR